MPRHLVRITLASTLAATIATAAAADAFEPPDPQLDADWHHYQREVANDLIARDDARSLALAAMLVTLQEWQAAYGQPDGEATTPASPRESLDLLERAFALGRDDELALTAILGVVPRDTTLARDAAQRLLELAPDNGAAWLAQFRSGKASVDEVEAARLLAGLAGAQRFDTHFKPILSASREAFARLPPAPDAAARMLEAGDIDDADLLPDAAAFSVAMLAAPVPYGSLTRACPDGESDAETLPDATDHAAHCRNAGKLLATRADTLIARSVGFRVWQAWAEDPDAVAAEHRRLDWLMEASAQVGSAMFDAGEDAAYLRHMLEAWRDTDATEIDVMRATLTDAGIALEPPADFVPARERIAREHQADADLRSEAH